MVGDLVRLPSDFLVLLVVEALLGPPHVYTVAGDDLVDGLAAEPGGYGATGAFVWCPAMGFCVVSRGQVHREVSGVVVGWRRWYLGVER